LILSENSLPRRHKLVELLEELYINEAHGAWYFFAYPAYRRLPQREVEQLVEAGLAFRALWLVLDHLVDLEEDRRNRVVTEVRLALDIAREPTALQSLVERPSSASTQL